MNRVYQELTFSDKGVAGVHNVGFFLDEYRGHQLTRNIDEGKVTSAHLTIYLKDEVEYGMYFESSRSATAAVEEIRRAVVTHIPRTVERFS